MDKDKFKWTEELVLILQKRYRIDGPTKLAKWMGTTRMSVSLKAKRLGLVPPTNRRPSNWTPARIAELQQRYEKESAENMAREWNVAKQTIHVKARSLGLHTNAGVVAGGQKKAENCKTCDIHYFDKWTSNMAYILGFLFADGSITKRLGDVVVGLAISDREVVDHIKKELKSTRRLYIADGDRGRDGYNREDAVYLYLGSSVLVRRLMGLGMMPRKTYRDDPFPDVPDDMMPHFIRGYFDGDGTVFVREDGGCSVGFVGSPKFIIGLSKSLVRLSKMNPHRVFIEGDETKCGRVKWSAEQDVIAFHDFAYPQAFSFCLRRKKKVLVDWLAGRQ